MSEKFLKKVLLKIKEVEKENEDWLAYYEKRSIMVSAWHWVVEEAKKEAKKK